MLKFQQSPRVLVESGYTKRNTHTHKPPLPLKRISPDKAADPKFRFQAKYESLIDLANAGPVESSQKCAKHVGAIED